MSTPCMPKLAPLKMTVIGQCCVCGGEATIKVYELPNRIEQKLRGICCQLCLTRMLDTGMDIAKLTEERLNSERQKG